jgi:hypothetical protein
MSRRFPFLISRGCIAIILFTTTAIIWSLLNINWFANLAKSNIGMPIFWATVEQSQLYGLWLLTSLYILIGLFVLYYLHRAFTNIAKGELFNVTNASNIRRFSILLFAQVIAKPIYFSLSSVLLSLNHPAGEKMLSVSFGSQELITLGSAMILWVISDLLIAGCRLQTENKQFI